MVQRILIQQISICVYINNCKSSTLPVVSGVPQGRILGPFLFLIYINDLSSSMKHSKTFLFADDTKCLRPIRSPQDHISLQSDLDVMSLWSTFTSQNNVTTKKNFTSLLYDHNLRMLLKFGDQCYSKTYTQSKHIQRRATKYILNDYTSDYRSRLLIMLNLLPMSMLFELNDICFFVRSLQLCESPNHSFIISRYTSFSPNNTRSGTYRKLVSHNIEINIFTSTDCHTSGIHCHLLI